MVLGFPHHLHHIVGIATVEQHRVVEDSSPESKVKDILIPHDDRVNTLTHIIHLHSCETGCVGERCVNIKNEKERC